MDICRCNGKYVERRPINLKSANARAMRWLWVGREKAHEIGFVLLHSAQQNLVLRAVGRQVKPLHQTFSIRKYKRHEALPRFANQKHASFVALHAQDDE